MVGGNDIRQELEGTQRKPEFEPHARMNRGREEEAKPVTQNALCPQLLAAPRARRSPPRSRHRRSLRDQMFPHLTCPQPRTPGSPCAQVPGSQGTRARGS